MEKNNTKIISKNVPIYKDRIVQVIQKVPVKEPVPYPVYQKIYVNNTVKVPEVREVYINNTINRTSIHIIYVTPDGQELGDCIKLTDGKNIVLHCGEYTYKLESTP